MEFNKLDFERVRVGGLLTNCYIIFNERNNDALLIDPAFDVNKIEKALNNYRVTDIILTHGHIDHYYELNYFKNKYKPKIYIHEADLKYLNDYNLNAPAGFFKGMTEQAYSVDTIIKDGELLIFGDYSLKVIHTPGHTQGSVCLLWEDKLFCGDTLFNNSVGRTDFPLSSYNDLKKSIKKLMLLDDEIKIFPGHGFASTIGIERQNNEYIKYMAD
jgi:glyoxylase-like metal-dependent hydrolase (beta-lactamase superfamily II)